MQNQNTIRSSNQSIDRKALTVSHSDILKSMGMELKDADSYLLELLDAQVQYCTNICSPKFSFKIFNNPNFPGNGILSIENVNFNIGKILEKYLHHSELLAFFVVTIGNEIENYSKEHLIQGNGLEGLISNLIGSELAEQVADICQNEIEKVATKSGFKITNRYSPGYCNWNVSEQHQLFSLLGNDNCGIILNTSALMMPEKSVSGIIGIGSNVKSTSYKCHACNDEKCPNRLKGNN
jgi:hypothetical protein